jgi:hypothetical protein
MMLDKPEELNCLLVEFLGERSRAADKIASVISVANRLPQYWDMTV